MSFYLASELDDAKQVEYTAGADITKGDVLDVNGAGLIGFAFTDIANGEKGTVVIGGDLWKVDCDATLAFAPGDPVYQDTAAITGIVNKTSGGTNVIVGYSAKDYPIGSTQILIVPKGV